MNITEVRITLRDEEKLKAFASITFDDSFVFKRGDKSTIELKKIDGDTIEGILSNEYGQGPIILLKVESMPENFKLKKARKLN